MPWKHFDVDGIILNACDILSNPTFHSRLKKNGGLSPLLSNEERINIILDSGGFLFQKREDISVKVEDLIDLIKAAEPCFSYALDHPLDPSLLMKNWTRLKRTIKNTSIMYNRLEVPIIPIMHGYTINQLEYCATEIKRIYQGDPEIIAVGSIVPLIRTSGQIHNSYFKHWEINSRRVMAINIIRKVKEMFPESALHLFGIGGTNIMHLMFLLVDSVDSIGWRRSAANGMVRIFNAGERYISNKNKSVRWNSNMSEEDWVAVSYCGCPVCKVDPGKLAYSFAARAIHNAYVYQQEVELARKLINKKRYVEFLSERFQSNRTMNSLLNYMVEFDN